MKLSELTLHDLTNSSEFVARHNGEQQPIADEMLHTLGYETGHVGMQKLMQDIVPASIYTAQALNNVSLQDLPHAMSEAQALAHLRAIAQKNIVHKNFIGQGYFGTHTPGVILRNILENPAWYTAYTPYQPEISQGRLEALLNFQTLICDMTGMDIASASLLDEATAAAEAMTLAKRGAKNKSNVVFVADNVAPQTLEVIRTRAEPLEIEVKICTGDEAVQGDSFAVILQNPGVDGVVRDYTDWITAYKTRGGVVIMATDLLALTQLKSPAEQGADIAIGSAQRFGVPFGYGGPHAGFLGCKDAYKRNMPGRLVGISIDAQGKPAMRLALQTREQHIRREKATSNICTAQVLLAVMASMYAVYHGPAGLGRIAQRAHRMAGMFVQGLKQTAATASTPYKFKHELESAHYFDTVNVIMPSATAATEIHARAYAAKMNLRHVDANTVGVSFDETTTADDVLALLAIFTGETTHADIAKYDIAKLDELATKAEARQAQDQPSLQRNTPFMIHPVFHRYHSETEMLRYIRRLSDKDLALDRSMIPLGSCTMKLNATSEMIPVTWPEFSQIHPFAPADQTRGYAEMTARLESWLCEITGYDAMSLQPNSGAQGEYAGLLAIRAYHRSRGDAHRTICLIPQSAHGTNPASAQMCGMEVVVVACDAQGNVDMADLQAKAAQHSNNLAALMVTYPSTHGVFETEITQICALIHQHGGQVYMDGANLNALVCTAQPGKFGSDVSHLNLHKTFCIPHGGGGPGVGPIGVGKHLAPFLPKNLATGHDIVGAVSAAPFGSASILPISYMYICMMGAQGLRAATELAILNANYIAKRLAPHYPVLYSGADGLVAHECILDIRPIKDACGISNEDIAKRLMDYGFHAPTMSFPVAGTLMIEPTESESKVELDRFIDAMICIRHEITAVETGRFDKDDNPLKHAPHTAEMCLSSNWPHAYSREIAAYPAFYPSGKSGDNLAIKPIAHAITSKYWPTVARVDNVYGDRNLVCACPPMTDYQ